MATIVVSNHNEDIQNIVKPPDQIYIKSPRYVSKYKHASLAVAGNRHDTFGYAHYKLDPPSDYLKKNSRLPPVPKADTVYPRCLCKADTYKLKRPFNHKTGKREDAPVSDIAVNEENLSDNQKEKISKKRRKAVVETGKLCSCKDYKQDVPGHVVKKQPTKQHRDFVSDNMKWADNLVPTKPDPKMVFTHTGEKQDMKFYLEAMRFLGSDGYGKLPKYLCDRMKLWGREREAIEKYCKEERERAKKALGVTGNVVLVEPEERQKLLDGLKSNWEDLSRQFQVLPVITDSIPKINRKSFLEKQLQEIERDIALVENHPNIYLDKRDYDQLKAAASKASSHESK